jgi:hypothetical protein
VREGVLGRTAAAVVGQCSRSDAAHVSRAMRPQRCSSCVSAALTWIQSMLRICSLQNVFSRECVLQRMCSLYYYV